VSHIRLLLHLTICAALFPAIVAPAQTSAKSVAGPIPPAIRAAKSIFVSNGGADSGLFPSPFSGDPNRGYNQFYAGLKASNQFQLVNDPADADLVLELQLTAPSGSTVSMTANKQNGAADPVPMFRLAIYDRKSHYVLWALTESIEIAFLQKTHDHNFDLALNALLADFEGLAGRSPAPAH